MLLQFTVALTLPGKDLKEVQLGDVAELVEGMLHDHLPKVGWCQEPVRQIGTSWFGMPQHYQYRQHVCLSWYRARGNFVLDETGRFEERVRGAVEKLAFDRLDPDIANGFSRKVDVDFLLQEDPDKPGRMLSQFERMECRMCLSHDTPCPPRLGSVCYRCSICGRRWSPQS